MILGILLASNLLLSCNRFASDDEFLRRVNDRGSSLNWTQLFFSDPTNPALLSETRSKTAPIETTPGDTANHLSRITQSSRMQFEALLTEYQHNPPETTIFYNVYIPTQGDEQRQHAIRIVREQL